MLKIEEVFETQVRQCNEQPDGNEYITFAKAYETRECLLNTDYVVAVRPYEFTASSDASKLAGVFPDDTKFSVLILDGNSFRTSEVIVVGSFEKLCRRLQAEHA